MKIKHIYSLPAILIILSSCALMGPAYNKPIIAIPTKWRSIDNLSAIESASISQMAWWKQFNDRDLNNLILLALENNNNIQIAIGNSLEAKAYLNQINMNWVPNINLGAIGLIGQTFNSTFNNNNGNPAITFNPENQNFNGYAVGFIPNYSINIFNQIKQTEIAKLNFKLQQQTVNAVKLAIISQVTACYFNLLGLHKQLIIQQKLLGDSLELKKYVQMQFEHGRISIANVVGLEQYIANVNSKIPDIENNITQIENALQILTNNNPNKIIVTNSFDNIKTSNTIPINLPSDVLKNRPDVAIAEYQLQITNANIGAVKSAFFPKINLTGLLGQGSLQLKNLFNAGSDVWAGELGATMPLLNMGLYSLIDRTKAQYYSAYYNYLQTVREAFSQVDNALAKHNNSNKTADYQQIALNKAQRLYDIAKTQYSKGAISYFETLALKINADYEFAKLNQIKVQQLNSIVNVYQSTGGGYITESMYTKIKKFNDNHDI